MPRTLRELVSWATHELQLVSPSARLDAEILLAHVLDRDRAYLLTWPDRVLPDAQRLEFQQLVQRRGEPQPVAYLVGYREFYSLRLQTTPATLVPRAETEQLVDAALARIAGSDCRRVIDLGTGSGAIALAIKRHAPSCNVTATDIDPAALAVARANGEQLDLKIDWVESDWFGAFDPATRFDLVVSNPPYVPLNDPYLGQGDLPAEPRRALVSGARGLDAIEQIIQTAPAFIRPGGWLLLEHGYDQQQPVAQLMTQRGLDAVETQHDLNDLPRITLGRWPG